MDFILLVLCGNVLNQLHHVLSYCTTHITIDFYVLNKTSFERWFSRVL